MVKKGASKLWSSDRKDVKRVERFTKGGAPETGWTETQNRHDLMVSKDFRVDL